MKDEELRDRFAETAMRVLLESAMRRFAALEGQVDTDSILRGLKAESESLPNAAYNLANRMMEEKKRNNP